MCLLPPDCLYCRHLNRDDLGEGRDCTAFDEIPEAVYRGDLTHRRPLPGDHGVRFELHPSYAEEFAEVSMLRRGLQSVPDATGRAGPMPPWSNLPEVRPLWVLPRRSWVSPGQVGTAPVVSRG